MATKEEGHGAVGAQIEALSRQDGDEHVGVGQGPHARRQKLGHGGKEGKLGAVQEDLLLEEDGIKSRQQVFRAQPLEYCFQGEATPPREGLIRRRTRIMNDLI